MAGDRRRWWMLGLGMGAQAASCVFLYGLPYLVPHLRHQLGLSLTAASALAAAPLIGVIVALVAWGALADRYGERLVITAGLAIAGGALLAATRLSGRWHRRPARLRGRGRRLGQRGQRRWSWAGSAQQRGLAMGARQTAQPLGTMLAAAALPAIAAHSGLAGALGACGALCLAAAALVAIFATDPPRRPVRHRAGAQPLPLAGAVAHPRGQHAARGAAVRHDRLRAGVPGGRRGWSPDAGRVIAIPNLRRTGAVTRTVVELSQDNLQSSAAAPVAAIMAPTALGMWWRSPLTAGALLAASRCRSARTAWRSRRRGDRGHVLGRPSLACRLTSHNRCRGRDAAGHGAAHRADGLPGAFGLAIRSRSPRSSRSRSAPSPARPRPRAHQRRSRPPPLLNLAPELRPQRRRNA